MRCKITAHCQWNWAYLLPPPNKLSPNMFLKLFVSFDSSWLLLLFIFLGGGFRGPPLGGADGEAGDDEGLRRSGWDWRDPCVVTNSLLYSFCFCLFIHDFSYSLLTTNPFFVLSLFQGTVTWVKKIFLSKRGKKKVRLVIKPEEALASLRLPTWGLMVFLPPVEVV